MRNLILAAVCAFGVVGSAGSAMAETRVIVKDRQGFDHLIEVLEVVSGKSAQAAEAVRNAFGRMFIKDGVGERLDGGGFEVVHPGLDSKLRGGCYVGLANAQARALDVKQISFVFERVLLLCQFQDKLVGNRYERDLDAILVE